MFVIVQAKTEFEEAGLKLFVTALHHGSAMRPKTLWGLVLCALRDQFCTSFHASFHPSFRASFQSN
jgi:hypothetical protein